MPNTVKNYMEADLPGVVSRLWSTIRRKQHRIFVLQISNNRLLGDRFNPATYGEFTI